MSGVVSALALSGISFYSAEILSLSAALISDYSIPIAQGDSHFAANFTNQKFCPVSVIYAHPGQDDTINLQVWLPSSDWNGRFLCTGGGGYAGGFFDSSLATAVSGGYSAAYSDAGHDLNGLSPETWALLSPGNVNLYLFQDFATVARNEMTVMSKAITETLYGTHPRYPDQYDGILAAAPAANWEV